MSTIKALREKYIKWMLPEEPFQSSFIHIKQLDKVFEALELVPVIIARLEVLEKKITELNKNI